MHRLNFNFTKNISLLAICLVIILFISQFFTSAEAAIGINRQINFQGKLVNNPLSTNVTDTTYTVVFTFYDKDTGGTVLWQETQTVTTTDGIFRVALGSVTPFPSNFNFNWSGLYLGIKVNSDSEMTPRIQMAAVPFAFNAEKVAGLTVQDTSGNASTSGTLQVGNGKTISFADNISFGTGTTGTIALGSGSNTLTLATTGNTSLTLPQSGTLCTTTSCALSNWFNQLAGALVPLDTTNDFLLGSTATSSALFSYTGIKTGQTIASVSGELVVMPNVGYGGNATIAGQLTLGALNNAIIQSVANKGLTIGGNTTGQITFSPNGTQTLVMSPNRLNFPSATTSLSPNNGTGAFTMVSDLSLGARSSSVLSITQANDSGNNSSASLLNLSNSDTGSTTSLLSITQVNAGTAISIAGSSDTGGIGISFTSIFTGTSTGLKFGSPFAGSALGISFTGTGDNYNFGGDFINISPTYTNSSGTNTMSGNFLDLTRTVIANGGTYNITGDLAKLSTTCTESGGTCTDNSKVLSLLQNLSKSTGTVLDVSSVGLGIGLNLTANSGGQSALIINKTGNLDIFTASSAGNTKFALQNDGKILAPFYTTCTLKSDSTGLITCGTDLQGGGTNWWNQLAGALVPLDTTNDFLLGSTATSSALFSYTGIKTGQTIASVSGSLVLMPNNGWGGQVGIGTTSVASGYTFDNRGFSIFGNQQALGFGGNKIIYANSKTTDASNDSFAVLGSLEANPSGDTSNIFYGGFFNVISSTGNIQNFTGRLVGFQGQVSHNGTGTLGTARGFAGFITNVNGGTITDSFAGRFGNTNAGAGQITNAYGVYIVGGANNGGGSFLNNYGLYVENQRGAGSTLSYNIYSAGDSSRNYLAGNLGIGTTDVGNGQLVVNQTNFAGSSGDVFAASTSGTTKFRIANNGDVVFTGVMSDSDSNLILDDTVDLFSTTTGLRVGTDGDLSDIDDTVIVISDGLTVSGAIGANGGITFDAASDTIGAFTMAGNIIGGSFIITDIGSTGTDFDTSGGLSITTDAAGTALTVDNAANASSIFVAEDNNSPVFTIADGGNITMTGTLAVNGDSITADGATLTINAAGAVDIQDGLTVDSLTIDTGDITWSGTTPSITINAAETFTISNGTAADNFTYNTSTNALTIGDGTNGLTFDIDTGMTYQGSGRKVKRITLNAEYPGAILTASGSATTNGAMTSDASPSAALSNWRTYYEWSSSQTTLQDYTVAVRVKLPEDFSAWDLTNALTISYNTELPGNGSNKMDVVIYNADTSLTAQEQATPVVIRTANISASAKTWLNLSIDDSDLIDNGNALDAAGDTAVIYLKMYSKDDNHVQIGDITLSYLSAF